MLMRQEPTETETKYNTTSAIPTRLFLSEIWYVLRGAALGTAYSLQKSGGTYLYPRIACDIMVCMTTGAVSTARYSFQWREPLRTGAAM